MFEHGRKPYAATAAPFNPAMFQLVRPWGGHGSDPVALTSRA